MSESGERIRPPKPSASTPNRSGALRSSGFEFAFGGFEPYQYPPVMAQPSSDYAFDDLDSSKYIGVLLDLRVGEDAFQGRVERVNVGNQSIILRQTFKNGLECKPDRVEIKAANINDVRIIDEPERMPAHHSHNQAGFPKSGTGSRSFASFSAVGTAQSSNIRKTTTREPDEAHGNKAVTNSSLTMPLDFDINEDFDFSEMNAKFAKLRATTTELDGKNSPTRPSKNFKHTENVLKDETRVYQSSKATAAVLPEPRKQNTLVGAAYACDYITDSGQPVPTITFKQRKELYVAARQKKFGPQFVGEILARACVELCLQIVGGMTRMNDSFAHAVRVVLLCGTHCLLQCEIAHRLARHFANRGVELIVYVPADFVLPGKQGCDEFLATFAEAKTVKIVRTVGALLELHCDIIVSLLSPVCTQEFGRSGADYRAVVEWANGNRAKIFGVEPVSTSIEKSAIETSPLQTVPAPPLDIKWALFGVAPVGADWSPATSIFLCDLGIPRQLYTDTSVPQADSFPFGAKFCIQLHRQERAAVVE